MPLSAAYGSSPIASATGRAASRKPCRIRCPSCAAPVQQKTSSASGSPTPSAGAKGSGGGGSEGPLPLRRGPGPEEEEQRRGLAARVGGDEGRGGGVLEGRNPAELPRRRPDELLEVGQQGRRVRELEEDRPAEDGGHRVQPVGEPGDDAEVAAPAAQCPEQVGVPVLVGGEHAAVGGDHLGGEQVVAGQPVAAAGIT